MTLAEHLSELRTRLVISVISVFLFGVIAFVFYPEILRVLQSPYCAATPKHCTFLVTNPLDGLTLRVKIAFFGGFLLSLPITMWHAWRFITPGLKAKERRYALPFVSAAFLFFAGGVAVAYFSFGHAIKFLEAIGGRTLVTAYNPNQYLTLFLLMLFVFGLTFDFPVVLVALEMAGLVKPRTLLRGWRYAVIAITIAAAALSPCWYSLSR
jgi:sec-independent protein translocase protein TatC